MELHRAVLTDGSILTVEPCARDTGWWYARVSRVVTWREWRAAKIGVIAQSIEWSGIYNSIESAKLHCMEFSHGTGAVWTRYSPMHWSTSRGVVTREFGRAQDGLPTVERFALWTPFEDRLLGVFDRQTDALKHL